MTFRGTSEVGNWFLTNAQAHMVNAERVFRTTGPSAVRPAGGVHQGFTKAFFDLWRKPDEPAVDDGCEEPERDTRLDPIESYSVQKWFWAPLVGVIVTAGGVVLAERHLLAGILPTWAVWDAASPTALRDALGVAVRLYAHAVSAALILQGVISYGYFERSFERSKRLYLGPPLEGMVDELVRKRSHDGLRVVFTGHSLGGALATLAFVDFRTKHPALRSQLVTFGAPSAGNDAFLRWFRNESVRKASLLLSHRGDAVPYLPPSSAFMRSAVRYVTPLSVLLGGVYTIAWRPYAWCYKVSIDAAWLGLVDWRCREGMTVGNHFSYKRLGKGSDGAPAAAARIEPATAREPAQSPPSSHP